MSTMIAKANDYGYQDVTVDGVKVGYIARKTKRDRFGKEYTAGWSYNASERFPGAYSSYYGTEPTKKAAVARLVAHYEAVVARREEIKDGSADKANELARRVESIAAELEDLSDRRPGAADLVHELEQLVNDLNCVLGAAKRQAQLERGL